jgi:GntR family transcriptional regulator, transcriptional repressor for pyruvate dehydrogenase complex
MKLSEAQISRVVVPKASGLLAGRLRQLILGGDFASGEMLPSERDLVSESGLSRGTVREALKILETEGLVVIRPGRLGGARVKVPQRGDLVRSTEQFLRANQVTLENLFDCRVAIEPMLARLAAIHRTDEELAALDEIHARFITTIDDTPRYRAVNFEWHLVLARASRNEPLTALMEAITTPVLNASGFGRLTTPETRREAIAAHSAIMDAVRRQEPETARAAMEAHLAGYNSLVKAYRE